MSSYRTTTHKSCTKCGEVKERTLEFFAPGKGVKDGLSSWCRVCRAIYNGEYNKNNREKYLTRRHKWQDANREKLREQDRQWRKDNPKKASEKQAKYYYKNRDVMIARSLEYTRNNPEHNRANAKNQKAKRRNAEGKISAKAIKLQLHDQECRCFYCGITLYDYYSVDHFIPIKHDGTNWPDNIVIACISCNSSKGAKLYEHWKTVRGW